MFALSAIARNMGAVMAGLCLALASLSASAAQLPIFDAHIHYSHDTWDALPPKAAIALLREAGVMRALVSSSNDDGTQKGIEPPRRQKKRAKNSVFSVAGFCLVRLKRLQDRC